MSLLINDFKQGWQNKARHELMHDDAVYVAKNVEFANTGSIKSRQRHEAHSTLFSRLTLHAPVMNIYQISVEGIDKQLIFFSDSDGLYRWNSATGVTTTISSALTSARHISYGAVKPILSTYTYVYITDGVSMISDNGTSTKTWGIDPPESAVSVSVDTTVGELTAGAYSYVYTFYDGATGSESDPSPACASITVTAAQSVLVSNLTTSSNSRVTARRLYRTIADGGTRYLIAIISDNVTTYYVDTIPDSSLTQAVTTDAGIPPTCDVVLGLKNVLFITGDVNYSNRVYNCIADEPDNWPSTYYVEVGNAGTVVQNLASAEGKVYAVTRTGVFGLTGELEFPDTFTTDETKSTVGTYARWSVASVGGGVYYLARNGIYRFDGVRSECVSTPIDKLFWDSPTSLYSVVNKSTAASVARATAFSGKYYITLPLRDYTGSIANALLEFDPSEKQWRLVSTEIVDVYGDEGNDVLFGSVTTTTENTFGSELITNGTMELDASWTDFGSPVSNVRSSTQKHAGTYSRAFNADSAADGIESATFSTTTQTKYRFTFWIYPPATSVSYVVYKGTGGGFYNVLGSATGLTANSWNQVTVDYTEPSGGNRGTAVVFATAGSGVHYVDDVSLKVVGYEGEVYSLLATDEYNTLDTINPEVVTKNYDFTSSPEDPVKSPEIAYGSKARRVTEIAWLKEYRVDATGTWTFEFFVDGVSRFSATLSNLTHADAYSWRAFNSKIKGRFVYVKATASGASPTTHELREIEIR